MESRNVDHIRCRVWKMQRFLCRFRNQEAHCSLNERLNCFAPTKLSPVFQYQLSYPTLISVCFYQIFVELVFILNMNFVQVYVKQQRSNHSFQIYMVTTHSNNLKMYVISMANIIIRLNVTTLGSKWNKTVLQAKGNNSN